MSHAIDVSEVTFHEKVIEASKHVPVLVDFWAAWCGPCRMLGPVLEKVARELDGAFVLAKVDTEAHPGLAQQFGVRGIPDVKLFVDGRVVAGFVGAQPEAEVRRFLEQHLPNELDAWVKAGEAALAAENLDGATEQFEQVIAQRPNHPAARLGLCRIARSRGDDAALREHARAMLPGPEADEAAALVALSDLSRVAHEQGTLEEVERELAQAPDDPQLGYAVGAHLAAQGRYEEALERLLKTITLRGAPRNALREAMLAIFALLGHTHPLTREYRRQLQIVL